MQTSTENVGSQNMTQNLENSPNTDLPLELEKSLEAQNNALQELNQKVNNWNTALAKQAVKQKDIESQEKKRRETSVKNLIGYEWKEARDGAKIEVVNPATSELIDTVPNVTDEDVDEAVKVAEIEQKKWAEVPIHERADKLYKFVDLVEENKERLARAFNRRNR